MAANTENLFAGYIKIFRTIRKHWIWEDPAKLKWWLDLLLEVNHADKKVNVGYQLFDCKRGQSINSMVTWAKRWRVDRGTVLRFMELLKNDEMIVMENLQKTSRITICNYDSYNGEQTPNELQTNSKRTAGKQLANTNNNDKNDKETIEGGSEAEIVAFSKFQTWLLKHGPRVSEMKQPFTFSDFIELKAYPKETVTEIIEAMHNFKPLLSKNISAILTFKNWAVRRKKTNGVAHLEEHPKAPPLKKLR